MVKSSIGENVQQMVDTIRRNDRDTVGALLDRGLDPNAVDEQAYPVLRHATMCRHYDLVELLLQRGANVNLLAPHRQTVSSQETKLLRAI